MFVHIHMYHQPHASSSALNSSTLDFKTSRRSKNFSALAAFSLSKRKMFLNFLMLLKRFSLKNHCEPMKTCFARGGGAFKKQMLL